MIEGLICKVEGAVPEPAESTNQGWSLTPVKLSDPAPVFVMLTPAGVGFDPPACAEKLRSLRFTVSAGAAGFTVKVESALLLGSAWLVAVTLTTVR